MREADPRRGDGGWKGQWAAGEGERGETRGRVTRRDPGPEGWEGLDERRGTLRTAGASGWQGFRVLQRR